MPAAETAAAGDARGLEDGERRLERRETGEMGAIRLGARDQIGTAIEKERSTLVLHRRRECLGIVDPTALVGLGAPQQDRRHVGGEERFGNKHGKPRSIGSLRGHEIEARGRAPRFGRFPSGRHDGIDCPRQSGGLGAPYRPSTLRERKGHMECRSKLLA